MNGGVVALALVIGRTGGDETGRKRSQVHCGR
jgi:hypothetical protein